jgi:hypothetical protein
MSKLVYSTVDNGFVDSSYYMGLKAHLETYLWISPSWMLKSTPRDLMVAMLFMAQRHPNHTRVIT